MCLDVICGYHTDDIFAYETNKRVRIRDYRIGLGLAFLNGPVLILDNLWGPVCAAATAPASSTATSLHRRRSIAAAHSRL